MSQSSRILITGASSGIGAEVARQIAARGARLVLVARRLARLEQVAASCRDAGGTVSVVQADVGVAQDCERLVNEAVDHLGGLDIVLLNAGIAQYGRVDTWVTPEVAEETTRINYLGAVRCTWHALPHLKASRGLLAVVSSLQGKAGFPGFAAYSGSKHALHGFFDALRGELIDDGVGVTLICPGPVDTEFADHRPDNAPGVMSVAECARLTIRALDRRRREEIMTLAAKVATRLRPLAAGLIDAYIRKRLDAFYRP